MGLLGNTGPIPLAGPSDIAVLSTRENYVDFGHILVPATIQGLIIKGEMEPDTQRLVAVTLELADSVLQVSVFSSARSEEIWPDVREQLAVNFVAQGSSVATSTTSLGTAIDVEIPGAQGSSAKVRFVGTDGPRWFLRGSISGAALDDAQANDLIEALYKSLVVDRGDDPMPPRELMSLKLPAGNVAPPRQL